MPCYILKAGDTEMVKIGWAETDVEARRRELQTAHWETLVVIRIIDGLSWVERSLHRHFADRRVSGEWFRFHPDMLTIEIADLQPRKPIELQPRGARAEEGISTDLLAQIEERAAAAGLTTKEVCRRANVAISTFWRWRNGRTNPSIRICKKLIDATAEPTS